MNFLTRSFYFRELQHVIIRSMD